MMEKKMEEKRDHKIYKYTNKVNGKVYIGRTCRTLKERAGYKGKGYKCCIGFWNAIQKYGWENFEGEILEEGLSALEAGERELYYIEKFDSTNNDKGYNIVNNNYVLYRDEVREKQSKILRGRKFSEEACRHISEGHKGHPVSEYSRKRTSETHKGKVLSQETKEKLRKANLGKRHSEETKRKIKEIKKGTNCGKDNPFYGKVHSDESRKKMRESNRRANSKKTMCIETKRVYRSAAEAAKDVGLKSSASICKSCKLQKMAAGYHWKYIDS